MADTSDGLLGPVFYSTFFTSLWLWLYALSQVAVRLAGRIAPALTFLKWALPIEERPLRSLGLVAAALACVAYWAIALVFGDPLAAEN